MFSQYLILGIEEGASRDTVDEAYRHMQHSLAPAKFPPGSLAWSQAEACLDAAEKAWRTLSDPQSRQSYEQQWKVSRQEDAQGDVQPKLGQLCVAAGIITLEDLKRAIENQESLDLPIGQVLQEQQLISQAELDGLLLGQQLIRLPADSPHSLGRRLMALGLVSEDMVRIALIEQRTFGRPIEDLLVGHGWLAREVLDGLLEPRPAAPAGQDPSGRASA